MPPGVLVVGDAGTVAGDKAWVGGILPKVEACDVAEGKAVGFTTDSITTGHPYMFGTPRRYRAKTGERTPDQKLATGPLNDLYSCMNSSRTRLAYD